MNLRILLILGVLTAFGPMAIDLYLPSFPELAKVFATDVEHIQLSLASYFVGMALGQLICGPLLDRFGRRKPLLIGIAIFGLASLACACAGSLEEMIVARFVQALGGCVGIVASRAIVRDLCDGESSARVFSQLMLIMGLAPILAPVLGGFLLEVMGWPSIFITLVLFSVATWFAVWHCLPETYPAGMAPAPLSGALKQYGRLLRDRVFMGHALTSGLAMGGMFAYIAGSPFVFIELYSVPAAHYGWVFGINAAGFILVSQINGRLLSREGPLFWLKRWVCFYLASGMLLLLMAAGRPEALWVLLVPLFCCIASLGGILPNATACALSKQAAHAGSASALLGSIQFMLAALSAAAVGALHNGNALPLGLVICVCGILAAGSNIWTLRQHRALA